MSDLLAATTLREALALAGIQLAGAGVPSPDADALALAAHVLGCEPREVRRRVALGDRAGLDFLDRYAELLAQRAERVPLQHLTGVAHFRHLTLQVGPGAFVPRPETEITAGLAIEAAGAVGAAPVVVDLCAGTGAIAFSVKDELPAATVVAVELSPEALTWADRNRDRLTLDVTLILGDAVAALSDLNGQVDVVVTNPPYIPDDHVPVDPEVADHDPPMALYGGGADGLDLPMQIVTRAADLLKPGGVLVMEHAEVQGDEMVRRLTATGDWVEVVDHRDLADRPRCLVARRR